MKKKILSVLSIVGVCTAATVVHALYMVPEIEPPAKYMKNLKTCTKSYTENSGITVDGYTIKGILPDGKCEVVMTSYENYADPKNYEKYTEVLKNKFGNNVINNPDFPTQAQMIEQGKAHQLTTVCKFTKEQREALYNAYLKHDKKTTPTVYTSNGIEFHELSKSSYDKLMLNYDKGSCTTSK